MGSSQESRKLGLHSLIRDFLISILPEKLIPRFFIRVLYGGKTDFVFLVHPRHKDDIYNTIPLLGILRKILPEKILLKILRACPAYVVAAVKWPNITRGLVVSTSIMPEDLFNKREETILELKRIVDFLRKIAEDRIYVGLAAWWPIVTNSGLVFKKMLRENDKIIVTNGHTATLLSLYLAIDKIREISGMKLNELKVIVIGAGRMGAAAAEYLNGRVDTIGMVERNETRLKVLKEGMMIKSPHSTINTYLSGDSFLSAEMLSVLREYDIAVCTTSNVNYIVGDNALLRDCVILDDSRPEAFPRVINPGRNLVVLEGGLVKFKGIEVDADFGFGRKDNVFGCMAEAIILALDKMKTLNPITGEIDYDNFERMLVYCRQHGITEGDFKSGHSEVEPEVLRGVVKSKSKTTKKQE